MYIGIGISINNRSCFINWLSNYLRWSTALTFSLTISLTFSLTWSKTLSLLSPVTTKRLKTNLSCVAFLFTFLFPFFFSSSSLSLSGPVSSVKKKLFFFFSLQNSLSLLLVLFHSSFEKIHLRSDERNFLASRIKFFPLNTWMAQKVTSSILRLDSSPYVLKH